MTLTITPSPLVTLSPTIADTVQWAGEHLAALAAVVRVCLSEEPLSAGLLHAQIADLEHELARVQTELTIAGILRYISTTPAHEGQYLTSHASIMAHARDRDTALGLPTDGPGHTRPVGELQGRPGATRARVLALRREGQSITAISRLLSISTAAVTYHMKRLRKAGELLDEGAGQ